MLWLRLNESYLHGQRTKRQLGLLGKFLAVRKLYSHVSTARIGVCLFEMSLNAIVNRFTVLSYDKVRKSIQILAVRSGYSVS